MKRISDPYWKYWIKCLMAYLRGKKTMNWIVGVLDVGSLTELDLLINEVKEYRPFPLQNDLPEIRKRVIAKQGLV